MLRVQGAKGRAKAKVEVKNEGRGSNLRAEVVSIGL